jgi:hypothetical protein
MWRSAGRILSGSRLGRRKTTFEATPHMAEIFLVGGRGNQRIAMSSDLIRDR